MTTRKLGRTILVAALALSMVLSITGGTIAWFTDEVTSTGNVIEAGTLDVKLYEADRQEYNGENTPWEEVTNDSAPLFDYDKWEPGYTAVKYVKIENAGNLAFKWNLNVKPAMKAGLYENEDNYKLAKVIDVYVAPADDYASFAEIKAAADVKGPFSIYELAEASLTDADGAAHGVMEADDLAIELVVALHMQEEAGNEYQGLSISDGFVIQLLATQATVESDSFGADYDAAAFNDMPAAFVKALTADELNEIVATDIDNNEAKLEVGYRFAATDFDINAIQNSHRLWHADFVVSFDKEVKANTIGLAGQYDEWSAQWVAIPLNEQCISNLATKEIIPANSTTIPAGAEIRLLKNGAHMLIGYDKEIYVNYEELCANVIQFLCGAYQIGEGVAVPTTMTVKLNLYEAGDDPSTAGLENNYETGKYITAGVFQYTFE